MSRRIFGMLIGIGLTSFSSMSIAEGWKFLPVLDVSYKPDTTLSIVDGELNSTPVGSGSYIGTELAFNCLILQPPSGIIRSKISYGEFDHNGLRLKTLEVNPRWTTKLNENLYFGVGPGIGFVKAEMNGQTTSMAAVQIGADLDYRVGALNMGIGTRWQDTRSKIIAPGQSGANNTLLQAKIGYNF